VRCYLNSSSSNFVFLRRRRLAPFIEFGKGRVSPSPKDASRSDVAPLLMSWFLVRGSKRYEGREL
jgi:hypothetical protein